MERIKHERIDVEIDGYIKFVIDLQPERGIAITFSVYEVVTWTQPKMPLEIEPFLNGFMKYDNCNHFYFVGSDGNGYFHLCGDCNISDLVFLLKFLEGLAREKIVEYDAD